MNHFVSYCFLAIHVPVHKAQILSPHKRGWYKHKKWKTARNEYKERWLPVGVTTCFSVKGRWPRPCSTTWWPKSAKVVILYM